MTGKQHDFLQAMLVESTVTKAAKAANISRNTAYKYLNDPAFREELSKRRSECVDDTVRYLQGQLAYCGEVLMGIIQKPDAADQVKINAINSVFANCKAMIEATANIEALERLERIEKQREQDAGDYL